ncbi:MAG: GNAT family N-acetyltransferase [Angelakisella sp.]
MVLAESRIFSLEQAADEDVDTITALFNSNPEFLHGHLGLDAINYAWIIAQQTQMREQHFVTAKLVERASGKVVGYCEYRHGETAYLSMFLMEGGIQGRLLGTAAYEMLEHYLFDNGSKAARIDVVFGYEGDTVSFWQKRGFSTMQDIKINWGRKILDAHVMVKLLKEPEAEG